MDKHASNNATLFLVLFMVFGILGATEWWYTSPHAAGFWIGIAIWLAAECAQWIHKGGGDK